MECYEGATMIKTYKGILADGGQDHIRIKTNKGDVGYKIHKFQIIGKEPGQQDQEHTVKIYKTKQSTIDNAIDFSDGDLLGTAYIAEDAGQAYPLYTIIIFDQEIFNQDIFITHQDTTGAQPCNYYLELEQVMLNDNESAMATLQSLRRVAER